MTSPDCGPDSDDVAAYIRGPSGTADCPKGGRIINSSPLRRLEDACTSRGNIARRLRLLLGSESENGSAKVDLPDGLPSILGRGSRSKEYTANLRLRLTWYDQRLIYDADSLQPDSRIQGDHWHAERLWLPSTLSTSNMVLNWDPEESLQFSDNFAVTGFQMLDFNCSSHVSNFGKIGNFSMIMCEFTLKRDFGPFLLEIYIPGITFVITSWFSLWIDIPAAPARVTLAMTTFLTLVTGGKSIREKLPKVPYVHALDVWYLACTAFVFFILLEYAMVNYIYHKDNRRRQGGMRRIESQASLASAGGSVNGSTYINVISALEQAQHQHGGLTPGQSAKGQCAVQIKYKKNNNGNYNKTGGPTVLRLTDLEPHSLPDLPDTPPRSPMSVRSFAGDEPPFVCTLITPLTPRDIANGIDRHCRYIFPLAFIVFNAIYWSMLTSS
ncbi:hypothetical protein HPB49_020571 [Dermacentor silvarum]|uniref:Uncharacterized protein n=1 Tax=Dermacentor silvarum TaxID=543639 RepID=A0ACB8CMQ4_DERSI|nr:hypothetical protein HPB49_020571 [Dermacentor silvarum]